MNFDFEGSIGVYKLYGVMRNVQVMRKGEKSPGGVGEPTCNLELVPPFIAHNIDIGYVHCLFTSDWDEERSIPIISNGSGSPPLRPFLGNLYPSSLPFPLVSEEGGVLVDRR
jgi:hypothetical protein